MKKIIIGAFAALASITLLAAPAAAKTKIKETVNSVQTNSGVDNYNGYRAFSGSEHQSTVDVKNTGSAIGVGLSSNNAVANSNVAGAGGSISGNIGSTGAGIGASIQAGAANTAAQSGSVAAAGALGAGSSRVEAGGYAVGSAGVRNEWGTNTTNGVTSSTRTTRTTN